MEKNQQEDSIGRLQASEFGNAQSAGMGKDQSHEASHLLSQPPSALIRHRHGQSTRFFHQTEEGRQAPIEREQTQNGQTRRWRT